MSDASHFRPPAGHWHPRAGRVAGLGWAAAVAIALITTWVPLPMGAPAAALRALRPLPPDLEARMARAEATARRGQDLLRQAKIDAFGAGAVSDPSGLIGQDVTPLVTTLGSLEAKRLSTNPAWAAVLAERLAAEGVGAGTVVAASLSGSFPGLNLALAAACQALDARLIAVSSVTASTWGANEPGFTWPEMEARLVDAGVLARVSIAVTAGGSADLADDLPDDGRSLAHGIRDAIALRLGAEALRPAGFEEAVSDRLRSYRRAAAGAPIGLYVNVGGADASMGRSPAILGLGAGIVRAGRIAGSPRGGVTARFLDERVPVLMLLNVRELAVLWGVPLSGRR